MSNTTVTSRGSKSGFATPGHRFQSNPSELVPAAVALCASTTCCLDQDEESLRSSPDDKYRKRLKQRKQRQLRHGLLLLFFSLCLLVYTLYLMRGGGSTAGHIRMAERGERPHHNNFDQNNFNNIEHKEGRRKHNQDRERGGRGRGRGGHSPEHSKQEHLWERQHQIEDHNDESREEHNPEVVFEQRTRELKELNKRMNSNTNTTVRWADMNDVPSLPGKERKPQFSMESDLVERKMAEGGNRNGRYRKFFQIHRPTTDKMLWEEELDAIVDKDVTARPDYVNYVHHTYKYPEKLMEPPELGKYPKMRTYKELYDTWPQDNLDNPPDFLQEDLIHFDWNNPTDMEAAIKFRTAKLPFKVINVPEVLAATKKWTDDYIAQNFDGLYNGGIDNEENSWDGHSSSGKCNEGPDNFFAFFNAPMWNIEELGTPPTRDNDWTFRRWAKHARYADRVGLDSNRPHYYWQAGSPKEERYLPKDQQTFVTVDLPSFSAKESNFVQWVPEAQKGIQCRFGERGITAANHYDGGRNMIAMITGAKRYILSPPRACKQLGIVASHSHPSFRHSMLNYGHIALLETHKDDMPQEEKEWLEMVGTADALSTVVKEGEILYVPTGWFHYITSLQRSAQCNVRSGPDMSGDEFWGKGQDIQERCFPQ